MMLEEHLKWNSLWRRCSVSVTAKARCERVQVASGANVRQVSMTSRNVSPCDEPGRKLGWMPRCRFPARNSRSMAWDLWVTNTVSFSRSNGSSWNSRSITASEAQSMSEVKQKTGCSSQICGSATFPSSLAISLSIPISLFIVIFGGIKERKNTIFLYFRGRILKLK